MAEYVTYHGPDLAQSELIDGPLPPARCQADDLDDLLGAGKLDETGQIRDCRLGELDVQAQCASQLGQFVQSVASMLALSQ